MLTRLFSLSAVVLSLTLLAGCGDKTEAEKTDKGGKPGETADPHDVPLTETEIANLKRDTATWPAAIQHIQDYRDTIKKETTGGTPAKAHRSLDLLDKLLERLPEAAQSSNVPKDDWQTVGENAQKLRDLFNRVHANIDDGKAPNYEAVSAEIDAAVDALTAIKAGDAESSQ